MSTLAQSIAFPNLSLLQRDHMWGGGACGSVGWALVTSHPGACHGRLIYKCSCEMVFNKKRHIQQHFYQNASMAQVGVFKCPECPLLFLQKPELMQHVKVGRLGEGPGETGTSSGWVPGPASLAPNQSVIAPSVPRAPMVCPATWTSCPASSPQQTRLQAALALECLLSRQPSV